MSKSHIESRIWVIQSHLASMVVLGCIVGYARSFVTIVVDPWLSQTRCGEFTLLSCPCMCLVRGRNHSNDSIPYPSARHEEMEWPKTGAVPHASWSPFALLRTHANDPLSFGANPSDAAKHWLVQKALHTFHLNEHDFL